MSSTRNRFCAWLQSIPFRVSHDDELLSILMLGACIGADGSETDDARYEAHRTFFRTYTEFLGVGDDWDLVTASDAVTEGLDFDLEANRAELIAQAADAPQINDQWRYAPDDPNVVAEPNFRIISAYRLPEAVLFQRTTDIWQFPARFFPSGLEVCIALGSTFARDKLDSVEKTKVLATIDENLGLFDSGTSLYFDYLRMIATLLDPPEPNAPDFMTAEPWQGQAVPCRGAVMPYYEFTDQMRLTDEDWKARLDSDARPDVPAWLRPIICEEGLSAPSLASSESR